ncbi:MAG TPA: calcium/sodium antiporter [Planctomycetota bacterium]
MDWLTGVLFFAGIALLVFGANWLVTGASAVAAAAGVSSLVIGLTVVAYGTSAPEVAVTVQAAWAGKADLAVANVVGSNIFNVLFILGAAAAVTPLAVARQLVRRDVPLMIGLSAALWFMLRDGLLNRLDGVLLVTGLVAYTVFIVRQSRREQNQASGAPGAPSAPDAESASAPTRERPLLLSVGFVLGGLALLVVGSKWLVDGAVAFAQWWGISDVVVGLTIVAAGTSLPEVATSIIAALRGERDIAVGNVVGSNLFNIMGALGVSAGVAPSGLGVPPSMVTFDVPVMIGVAVVCLPFFARGFTIPRWQGALFLASYLAYTTYLVLDATKNAAKDRYGAVMIGYVLPITALTLAFLGWRVWRRRHTAGA